MARGKVIITSAVTALICFLLFTVLGGYLILYQWDTVSAYLPLPAINENDRGTAPIFDGTVDRDVVAEESQIIGIVEQADPAVVSIVITKDVQAIEQYFFDPFGNNPFFRDFFGDSFEFFFPERQQPQQRENESEKREVGGGSGFFVSEDGLIITNRHVVDDDDAEYTVLLNDGSKYEAEVLAKDSVLDIAILRIDSNNKFNYLQFGNSDNLKLGQTVIAIGNALAEFRNSVSVGVVSGLSRSIIAGDGAGRTELLEGVIQTDAAINPGNSGGPLLDISGRVVGVNVAMQRGAQNIGFALPGNVVKDLADSVMEYGEIIRPYLGIRYINITESLQRANNLPVDHGALIQRGENAEELAVIPGSPADMAGLVENDIILEINGQKIDHERSLASIIRNKKVGETIEMKVWSKGDEKTVSVTLERAPSDF